jgi:hypothetical protein
VETLNARFYPFAGRKHNERKSSRALIRTESAQQTEAIQLWHHDVRQYKVGRIGKDTLQSNLSVGDGFDFVPFSKKAPDVIPHVGVVIGEYDTGMLLLVSGNHSRHCQASLL